MRVSRARHGDSLRRTFLAVHIMNFQPKIVPPLPPLSLGNLMSRVTTRFVVANSSSDNTKVLELKDLVGLVIDLFIKSKETMVGREDVFPTLLKTMNEINEAAEKGEVDGFMFTSLCRFPIYEADFCWRKPVWESRAHAP